jgi:hypothetical protein
MNKYLKIVKNNVMLNLQILLFSSKARITREGVGNDVQHRKVVRLCDPETSSGRRSILSLFIVLTAILSTLVFTRVEVFA